MIWSRILYRKILPLYMPMYYLCFRQMKIVLHGPVTALSYRKISLCKVSYRAIRLWSQMTPTKILSYTMHEKRQSLLISCQTVRSNLSRNTFYPAMLFVLTLNVMMKISWLIQTVVIGAYGRMNITSHHILQRSIRHWSQETRLPILMQMALSELILVQKARLWSIRITRNILSRCESEQAIILRKPILNNTKTQRLWNWSISIISWKCIARKMAALIPYGRILQYHIALSAVWSTAQATIIMLSLMK